jgi:predicted transcriptional regulator
MGRQRNSQPPPSPELIAKAFQIHDGALFSTRTGEAALVEKGIDGFLMARVTVDGKIRRFAVQRIAWVVHFGAWPKGIVRLRSDGGGYGADNLIETRRGQNPFAVGRASLIRRAERDASLLQAMVKLNGEATVPTISRLAGMGSTCVCMRLSALADKGLCAGPKCDARARWDLTERGREVATANAVVLDDRDRDILTVIARVPAGIAAIAKRTNVCQPTARRRIDRLVEHGLAAATGKRYTATEQGLRALGPASRPEPWVRVERVSAALAPDVQARHGQTVLSRSDAARLGGLARAAKMFHRPAIAAE